MRDKILLRQLQALPLDAKVLMTQQRIREWYNHWNGDVYISFSGGKDSTVLTHLVHDMYPDVPLVFANTGLEYPEIQAFARQIGAEFIRPKMSFSEVISKYGYPIIGKEIAEAISYARRIVPIVGGVQRKQGSNESRFKANERTKTGRVGEQTKRLCCVGGGGRTPRSNRMEKGESHREHATTKDKQRSNQNTVGRQREQITLRKIERFRKQLMGK